MEKEEELTALNNGGVPGNTDASLLIEDVYASIGGMGRYQWRVFILAGIISCFTAEMISFNFVGATQDHWCHIKQLDNLTHDEQKYVGIPLDSEGKYEECKMFRLDYGQYTEETLKTWNRSVMVDNGTAVVECTDGWTYDRRQYRSTVTSKLDLVCGRSWMVSLMPTLYMAGVTLGTVTLGYLADRYGRKKVVCGSLVLKVTVGVLTCFPFNYPWVLVTRFLQGYCAPGACLTCFILVIELVSHSWRSVLGVTFQILFSFGFMLWPMVAYFLRDDVTLQLTLNIPLVLLLSYWWLLDESPRWLIVNKHYDEAERVLKKIARVNKSKLPDHFDVRFVSAKDEDRSKKTYFDLLRSPVMFRRVCILNLHWFTDSLMYYALSLNTEALFGNIYINTAVSGAVEIPANILAVIFINWHRTGRRITCSFSLIIAGAASLVSIYMVLTDKGLSHTIFSMVAKAFVTMGFSGIYVYTSELLPTEVRNVGIGTASMCARISGMTAAYIGGPLATVWGPLPSLIFGVLATVAGLLTLLLPETLGQQLPNTIEEVEALGRCRRLMEDDNDETSKPLPVDDKK